MSRGFGATLGVGTTDIITTPTITHTNGLYSYWIRSFERGHGGSSLGRFWDWDSFIALFDNESNSTGTWAYQRGAPTPLNATFTAPALNTVAAVGVFHDDSSVANLPIVYLNGTKLTSGSGLTVTGPTGSFFAPTVGISVGNRASDSARNWDGWHADYAVWNTQLTDAEFLALYNGARPWKVRPGSLVVWLPLDGIQSPEPDIGSNLNKFNGTVTGTAKQFGPPFSPITPRWPQYFKPPVAGGPFLVYQRQTLAIPLQTSVAVTLGVHS